MDESGQSITRVRPEARLERDKARLKVTVPPARDEAI
jgi:hypothetical protein